MTGELRRAELPDQLEVYQTAIEFVHAAVDIAAALPTGNAYLADQLRRAATSIPLNIAEGASEFARKEIARFYRMAKRSATECAAILDVCRRLNHLGESVADEARDLLISIVNMLIRMVRSMDDMGGGLET